MNKKAILTAFMIVAASTAVILSGCGGDDDDIISSTQPSATPIATVAPTKAPTVAPTVAPTQPTVPTMEAPTQAATFNSQLATGTMPSTVPTGTEVTSTLPSASSPYSATEMPTSSSQVSPSLGEPDVNGNYTLVGTVTGFGPNTVVIVVGDGNEYEFNYVNSGISMSQLYNGAPVTIIADGDPSGAGVPNAVQMYMG